MPNWSQDWVDAQFAKFPEKQRPKELVFEQPKAAAPLHKLGRGQRCEIDGFHFQSNAEARRYQELELLRKAGAIFALEVHPSWTITINGVKICRVVLDFAYIQASDQKYIVEDVKRQRTNKQTGKVEFSTDTRISKIGRRLVKAVHGIDVTIIKV